MIHQSFGVAAGVLGLIQAVPYVISILHNKTRPHRTSYFIWFVIDLIQLATYYRAGARGTIYLTLAFTFVAALIFALSLSSKGMGGRTRIDLACLVLGLVAVAVWVTTGSAVLALYASIGVQAFGYIPTILKSWRLPQTENILSWVLGALATFANLAALTVWRPDLIALPLAYAFLISLVTAILVLRTRHFKIKRANPEIGTCR